MVMNFCFNEKHKKSQFCATTSKRSISWACLSFKVPSFEGGGGGNPDNSDHGASKEPLNPLCKDSEVALMHHDPSDLEHRS